MTPQEQYASILAAFGLTIESTPIEMMHAISGAVRSDAQIAYDGQMYDADTLLTMLAAAKEAADAAQQP
ncbi:MAG: hypothetical protein LLG20_01880 [Acidobacteriales bacterium]|nr:hypothetical protein [Terriglobales bacterium]